MRSDAISTNAVAFIGFKEVTALAAE